MLQVLLGNHPQVATTVELTLFDEYISPWQRKWELEIGKMRTYGHHRGLPTLWSEAEFEEFLREFLRRAYAKVEERLPGRTHLLDKNPIYSQHVHAIKRLLPQARFLHVIRDGRDVVSSLMAAKEMGFGLGGIKVAAGIWRSNVEGALAARAYGSDYLELRYEDFLGAEKTAQYRKVLEFCGLAAEPAWITETLEANTFDKMKSRRATGDASVQSSSVHYRKGKAGGWREEFTPRDRYEFSRIAGDLLCQLGYAQEGWWADDAMERWRLPLEYEARRRGQIVGLALTLLRRGLLGQQLPEGFRGFEA